MLLELESERPLGKVSQPVLKGSKHNKALCCQCTQAPTVYIFKQRAKETLQLGDVVSLINTLSCVYMLSVDMAVGWCLQS